MSPNRITEATCDALEEHAIDHLYASHQAAERAFEVDEYSGMRTYGMALYENLRRRFLHDLVPRSNSPFQSRKMPSGYKVPVLDHKKYGQVALYHHRVEKPEYLPKQNSGRTLKDHVLQGRDLFGNKSRPVVPRLLGLVGGPITGLEEVVVGRFVPRVPASSARLAHKQKLDLGSGSSGPGDGGIGDANVDPEPDVEPEVGLKEEEKPKGSTRE